MISIYVLQLQDNKYYIGKTTNPEFRLHAHFNSYGSAWTQKYPPLQVIQIYHNCNNYDEDKYTLQYMEKYGINNVRGGSFCQIKLTEENKQVIQKMLNNSNDRCFICGSEEHFAKDCSHDVDEVKSLFSQFKAIDDSVIDEGIVIYFKNPHSFTGEDIIEMILEQKQCAIFICEKIYKYFVNDIINKDHIDEMVAVFYGNYNIEILMKHVFMSDWFYDDVNIGTKIKSPIDLIIGIQRTVPVYFTKTNELFRLQNLLDQFLLFPPNVAGWKGGKYWITTNSLMLRIKLPSMILEKESYTYQYRGNLKNLRIVSVKNKYQEKN